MSFWVSKYYYAQEFLSVMLTLAQGMLILAFFVSTSEIQTNETSTDFIIRKAFQVVLTFLKTACVKKKKNKTKQTNKQTTVVCVICLTECVVIFCQ